MSLRLSSPLAVATALANAATGIRSAKPLASATVTVSSSGVTVDGSRAAQFPVARIKQDNLEAVLALLGLEAPAASAASTEADERMLRATRLELSEARADVARLDGYVTEAADSIAALKVERDSLKAQLGEAVKTMGAVRDGKVSLAPAKAPESSILADIAEATVAKPFDWQDSALPDHFARCAPLAPLAVPTLPTVDGASDPVTIAFPVGEQSRLLKRAGLDVAALKAAGFSFRFFDRKAPTKGGQWEARATAVSRSLCDRIAAVLV